MTFDPKLNLYTPESARLFYDKVKQLNNKSPVESAKEYQIELGGGTYVFKGEDLLDLQTTLKALDKADNNEDGYFESYYKELDKSSQVHLIEKKWGRNILSVPYESFYPKVETNNEFVETEDAIYQLAISGNIYWSRSLKNKININDNFDPNDLHSLAELALTNGVNNSILKMFLKSSQPYKNAFCLDRSNMGGTGIMNATSMQTPQEGTIILSLEAYLDGVRDAKTAEDALRNMGGWVNHECGHILMLTMGSIVKQAVAPYLNFNQLMAGGMNEQMNLFLSLLNNFQMQSTQQINLAYQFAYMTQEVCDPVTAWHYSEVYFATRAIELNTAIDWWIKDIDKKTSLDDFTMMRIAYIMQMARYCNVESKKIEILKSKIMEKLNEKQRDIFEKLSKWFAFVQNKFDDSFTEFNKQFGNIVKPYDPNAISQ